MKILVVHEVSYLSKIIYEFQILPEMLSMLGHDVTVIDYNDSWQNEKPGRLFNLRAQTHSHIHRAYSEARVTVRSPGIVAAPILSRISGAVTNGIEVLRALKNREADAILLYGLPTVGLQSILAARAYEIPIIFRCIDVSHELVPYRLLKPPTKILERLIFRSVDLCVALTPHLKTYILSYGVPDADVRLLPSGVDCQMFSPGPYDAASLARWGIVPEDRVILFMGTIYKFSGLDQIIREYPTVLRAHPRAKLLIVGMGEDETRLRRLVVERCIESSVIFTGLLPYADLPGIIRSSDVCINPFELNGITKNILPTKLFQYMACEKPVIATPLPGTEPFLAGEEHGVVYTSIAGFSETIVALLSDKVRCRKIGESARRTAEGYDWKEIARTMASWLAEVA